MGLYIAVDCGKYSTKYCALSAEKHEYVKAKYRTKMSKGTFEDDMLEKGTFLVKYDGEVYKIGAGARKEAEMETSKKTLIHKICTLAAIAKCICATTNEKNVVDVNVVIGIPYQLCCIPEERIAYKNFILPEGKYELEIKLDNNSPVQKVTFNIQKRFVYPESIGVLYQYPSLLCDMVGILDIGNLNINATYCDKFQLIQESCFTDELGGQILISGLAQDLTSELNARCDDNLIAATLLKPLENRYLVSKNGNKEVEEKTKKFIDKYLKEHVLSIRQKCDKKHWSLEFISIVVIGGTAKLLSNEIKEVLGENVFIPAEPEFVNVEGFLKKMCAEFNIDATEIIKASQED